MQRSIQGGKVQSTWLGRTVQECVQYDFKFSPVHSDYTAFKFTGSPKNMRLGRRANDIIDILIRMKSLSIKTNMRKIRVKFTVFLFKYLSEA